MNRVYDILGGTGVFKHKKGSAVDFGELIKEGLPLSSGLSAQEALGLTDTEMAAAIGVSMRTWQRKKDMIKTARKEAAKKRSEKNGGKQKLSSVESDRLFRMARIFEFAVDVLGGEEQAKEWLHEPQYGLGGRVPIEMMETDYGSRQVEELLGRIEYGVLA
jgi:uncharacterized protein (DUF2384 family)